MLFKNSKKDDSKKEFIQYKDGKIVSVEVEKPRKPQGVLDSEEIPLYQEIEEKIPKEKLSEKLKKKMTVKKLKVIIAIVVLIFFAFTVKDIYKSFFLEEAENNPIPTVEEPSEKGNEKPSTPANTQPTTTAPSTKPDENKEPTKKPDEKKKPSSSSDSLALALSTANNVNQVIIIQSSDEMKYINDYAERKANKIGLGNQLERSLQQKENAYFALTMDVNSFDDSKKKALYKATEERIVASINFTKTAQQFLVEGRGKEALRTYSNEYVVADESLRQKQVTALIEVLKDNDVSYKVNDVTKNVEFVLP